MREQSIFEAGEEYHREFQTLSRVQGHHLDAVFPGFRLAFTRFEHRMREERLERR